MKKTFYLVRHGEKIKQKGDPPLSELGVLQAQATAKHLKSFSINKIVASPILRTKLTAQYFQRELGLEVVIDDLLRERVNFGDDPNQTHEEFMSIWRQAYINRNWQPPLGDSSRNSGIRLQRAIELYSQTSEDHFLFVTHGGIITDFLLNVIDNELLNRFKSDFTVKNDRYICECSITIVEFDSEYQTFKVITLGSVNHLSHI